MTVVKRNRKKETFDKKKLYISIFNSCLNTQLPRKECEKIAKKIFKDVAKILEKQTCLLSEEITDIVTKAMSKQRKELAFMYATHKELN